MFSSKNKWICSDDNAWVNSHYMDLYDVEINPPSTGSDDHLWDVVLDLIDEEEGTKHRLMLNANHVIKAVEYLEDELGLNRVESETVCNALRLLERRTKQAARDWAKQTN